MPLHKILDVNNFAKLFTNKTHVITHRDWDGICSVALLKGFLQDRLGKSLPKQRILFSKPQLLEKDRVVTSYKQSKNKAVSGPLHGSHFVLFDLPFIPGAVMWLDHHDDRQVPMERLRRCLVCAYDPTSSSTVQLLSRMLQSYNFDIPEKLIQFTNRIDTGAYGKKVSLEDLESLPMRNKLCYYSECFRGNADIPLIYHIIDLIATNYNQLETLEDASIEERFPEFKVQVERGRNLIKAADYYHGLLIIRQYESMEKSCVCYWDIPPIFYTHFLNREGMYLPLLGYLIIRPELSCRLAVPWRFDRRLVELKHMNQLNIRPIAQHFGYEGHYHVVGFKMETVSALNEVKSLWDSIIQKWGFTFLTK